MCDFTGQFAVSCHLIVLWLQWKRINCKQSARWQHLSRLKASLCKKIFSCMKCNNLYSGLVTPSSRWWSTIGLSQVVLDIFFNLIKVNWHVRFHCAICGILASCCSKTLCLQFDFIRAISLRSLPFYNQTFWVGALLAKISLGWIGLPETTTLTY